MAFQKPVYYAVNNVDIPPSRFVKLLTTADQYVTLCGDNDLPVAVAHQGSRDSPGILGASGNATVSTSTQANVRAVQDLMFYAPGEMAILEAGGAVTAGDYLKSDSVGRGVRAGNGQVVGAFALTAASAAGELLLVIVLPPLANRRPVSEKAANYTATLYDANGIIFVTAADVVITLPAVATAKGLSFTVQATATSAALQAGSTGVAVAPASGEQVRGTVVATVANSKGIVNTKATAVQGDSATVYSDGTYWWVTALNGTWTRQA